MASIQEIRDAVAQHQAEAQQFAQESAQLANELNSLLGMVMDLTSSEQSESAGMIVETRSRLDEAAGYLNQLTSELGAYQTTLTVD